MEMTKFQLGIYLIALLGITIFISYLMEIYKKELRKSKSTKLENRVVAYAFSALGVLFLYFAGILKPIMGVIGAPLWVDCIFYNVVFYVAQFEFSMKLIKGLSKKYVLRFLEEKGFSEEEIKKLTERESK